MRGRHEDTSISRYVTEFEAAAAHPYRPHQINEQLRVQRAQRAQPRLTRLGGLAGLVRVRVRVRVGGRR